MGRCWLAVLALTACGAVKSNNPNDDAGVDGPASDGPPGLAVPVTSIAPSVAEPMYQGSQTLFRTDQGGTCTGRVAASMAGGGFCFLAADDTVKCAGQIDATSFGMSFGTTGQSGAVQIMVMFLDNGMCITKTDGTVVCMGSNSNAFGAGTSSQQFTQWTARTDIAQIASGTWDQICGITTGGQVFCGGLGSSDFGNPPIDIGGPGQTSLWVDTFGSPRLSDTTVLRPAESRTECQIKANGFICGNTMFGPTNGSIVMAVSGGGAGPSSETVCYLDTAGTVTCTNGPRFEPTMVLYLAGSFYSDSLCAIYKDGSVWCIGSNQNGKLGTGNNLALTVETMVAPPGSARVACDP
ncbi:MAG: hypothetical protein H0V17_27540 [Deltaproteobacteria bacterium]|nr:hypothetical protein [Deltaproteobacteria bacterium]